MKKRLFITGASGLLGANALWELREYYSVLGTYLNHPIRAKNAQLVQVNLIDKKKVQEVFEEFNPEIVLHTAAITDIDYCEENRAAALTGNVTVTETLARLAQAGGATFVQVSTDAFFSQSNHLRPIAEDNEPHPPNFYSETKLRAEKLVMEICEKHLILRTNIFGWNFQKKMNLAEWIVKNGRLQREIPLVDDVIFNPVVTNYFAHVVRLLDEQGVGGVFNVTSNSPLSKYDFALLLCKTFGLNERFMRRARVKDIAFKAKRSHYMALSNEKIRKVLPSVDFSIETHIRKMKSMENNGSVALLKEGQF